MFESEIKLTGKHANYLRFLSKKTTELNKSKGYTGADIFKRNVDVFIAGALVGLVTNSKAEADTSTSEITSIFAEQVISESWRLKFIYRLTMLLNDSDMTEDERVDYAFKSESNPEMLKAGMAIFNSYVRGGIEYLYRELTEGASSSEEYATKVADFVREFSKIYIEEDPAVN